MIKITPLFSGSRGNSTLIQTPTQNVLLDLGYGFRATVAKLKSLNVDPHGISAVVITHEHSDHVSALPCWTKNFHTKVFAPKQCVDYIAQTSLCGNVVPVEDGFDLQDLHVDVYRCSHDARACFGYRFADGKMSVASVTDTGEATMRLVKFLAPCEKIVLESNHDVEMVQNGSYPYLLKRRILSGLGHLSNEQAGKILERLADSNVKSVVLGHLSQQNNTKKLAYESAQAVYRNLGMEVGKDVFLYVADQDNNEVTI